MTYLFDSGFSIFLLIILFTVAFVKISNLKYRITILESRLFSKKDGVEVAPVSSEAPVPDYTGQPIDAKAWRYASFNWFRLVYHLCFYE